MATAASRVARPERQNRLIFIGAVVLALLAAVLVFLAVSGAVDSGGGGGGGLTGNVDVVVASEEIPAGTLITGGMLTIATLPENGIAEGALQTPEGLEGLVVRQSMSRGDQFTAAKVGLQPEDSDAGGIGEIVPAGMRAIAVEVDEKTTAGGLIVPGDRVDVVMLRNDGDTPTGQLLLQNVEVLAVAQDALKPVTRLDKDGNIITTDTAEGELATHPDDASPNSDADTVTLSLAPRDAVVLALAQENGTVWLIARGDGDSEVVPVGPQELD